MTILNERRRRRSPKGLKTIIFLILLVAFLFYLYSRSGEQPMERVEQPVEIGKTEAE